MDMDRAVNVAADMGVVRATLLSTLEQIADQCAAAVMIQLQSLLVDQRQPIELLADELQKRFKSKKSVEPQRTERNCRARLFA